MRVKYSHVCNESEWGGSFPPHPFFLQKLPLEEKINEDRLSTCCQIKEQIQKDRQYTSCLVQKGYSFSVYHVWYPEETWHEASGTLSTWNMKKKKRNNECNCQPTLVAPLRIRRRTWFDDGYRRKNIDQWPANEQTEKELTIRRLRTIYSLANSQW